MKFQPQSVDPINGNDFIFRSFVTNAERRHRHFKAFFTIQDPRLIVPDRNKEPNWKVAPLLHHMNLVNVRAWKLGRNISVDEQTIGFQGNHKDKLRITYKAEGDGFQCDALCQEGYTYTFYYRNQPAPKKYLDQDLSPLHSRVMYMFDSLKESYHRCGMDNLYISAKFIASAFKHERKVLVAGVCRKGGRGFPQAVLQEEVKARTEQIKVRGTVKAAVLEGDESCPNLVAVSVYDTKPVHFLSMSCESIEWITKERKVFVASTGCKCVRGLL
jgi:Transposase IS4